MTKTRSKLNNTISLEDFDDFYWLKSELLNFCRTSGLSTVGAKIEIIERFRYFLKTGKQLKPIKNFPKNERPIEARDTQLSLKSQVESGFRYTREIRNFFEAQVGPKFHFSVELQNYIRANPGVSFQDIIDEWKRLNILKASGMCKTKISSQLEYKQFTRDFFADSKNRNKNHENCIDAWKVARSRRGKRKYSLFISRIFPESSSTKSETILGRSSKLALTN